jgi:hypothetical protein
MPGTTLKTTTKINFAVNLLKIYILKWKYEGRIEIHNFFIPSLDGSLPTSGKVSKPIEILPNLKSVNGPTIGTVVITDALIRPSLSPQLELLVPNLYNTYVNYVCGPFLDNEVHVLSASEAGGAAHGHLTHLFFFLPMYGPRPDRKALTICIMFVADGCGPG